MEETEESDNDDNDVTINYDQDNQHNPVSSVSSDQDSQHDPISGVNSDQDNQHNPLSGVSSDQDNQHNAVSDIGSDQDNQNALVSPNFNSPTFDLSYDQEYQDVESQQNVDQTESTVNVLGGDTTRDSPDDEDDSIEILQEDTHNFRNIRRTMSGALEVYGAVGVSVVARSSPHMQRRHPPDVPEEQEQSSTCIIRQCVISL